MNELNPARALPVARGHGRLVAALAVLFATTTTAYSVIWMYAVRRTAWLGAEVDLDREPGSVRLLLIAPGSPAARAGPPTAPVLGLIEAWECDTVEVCLGGGDILALFSDGITEAFSNAGEEFGETRLFELLGRDRELALPALVERVLAAVRDFSGSGPEDDKTILLARGMPPSASAREQG